MPHHPARRGCEPRKRLSKGCATPTVIPELTRVRVPKLPLECLPVLAPEQNNRIRVYTARERPSPKPNKTGGRYRFLLRAENSAVAGQAYLTAKSCRQN